MGVPGRVGTQDHKKRRETNFCLDKFFLMTFLRKF